MSSPDPTAGTAEAPLASRPANALTMTEPPGLVHIPSPWARRTVVVVVVAAFVSGIIGTALSPTLIVDHPLGMIALNATNRYLFLVTNHVDTFGFYAVALPRRLVPTIAFYLLGRWYGHRAVKWMTGREPASGDVVSVVQRLFDRFGWVIVALAPMTLVTLIAGASKLRPRVVIPIVTISIAVRLVLFRWLGTQFAGTLESIVDWIDRSRGPLMIVTVGLVLLSAWTQRTKRVKSFSELTSLDDATGTVDAPSAHDPDV